MKREAIVIVGPTACGKSGAAMKIAEYLNSKIINADSCQLYKDLSILSARPTIEDEKKAPHKLYGILEFGEECNAVSWSKLASKEMLLEDCEVPIIVGGTGLYINTLMFGASEIPEVTSETRSYVNLLAEEDFEEFVKKVYNEIPDLKEVITPDQHRQIIRAYEVFLETGKSITEFHKSGVNKFLDNFDFKVFFINPDRKLLHEFINMRLDKMIELGALEEVEFLMKKSKSMEEGIFNAIGVREFSEYISGKFGLDEAIEKVKIRTRQYAKRQVTWFKHQIKNKVMIESGEELVGLICKK